MSDSETNWRTRAFVLALALTIGALIAAAPWFFNRSSILALDDCTAATIQGGFDPGNRAYARALEDDQVRRQALQKVGQWTAANGFDACRRELCGALLDDGEGGVVAEVRPRAALGGPPLASLILAPDDLDVSEADRHVAVCP